MSVMTKERSLIATNVKESFKNFSHTSKMSRTLTTSGKESCNDNLPRCHRLPQQAERRPTMTNLTRLKMKGKGSHETRPEMKGKESHETGRWECSFCSFHCFAVRQNCCCATLHFPPPPASPFLPPPALSHFSATHIAFSTTSSFELLFCHPHCNFHHLLHHLFHHLPC